MIPEQILYMSLMEIIGTEIQTYLIKMDGMNVPIAHLESFIKKL